ncbi:MAG: uncharacterized protein PWQ67_772 [Clostridia bacterium]|jgi:predicted DNA-binding protein (UPF0251 family)|nr:uncharacterized protein [Clostridia bacterium]MDN5322318.1 uncharacterized protein [Clostridia bacterium]
MPRPPKCRRVEFEPIHTYFKPAGIPKHQLEELVLSVEELEAIRLKDREGLEQAECAEKMHVSRPTFQRILMSARSKLAEAIVEGKAIRVEGGNYRIADRRHFKCISCQYEFEVPFGAGCGNEIKCPKCDQFGYRIKEKTIKEE